MEYFVCFCLLLDVHVPFYDHLDAVKAEDIV